jgi:hypothetical protein
MSHNKDMQGNKSYFKTIYLGVEVLTAAVTSRYRDGLFVIVCILLCIMIGGIWPSTQQKLRGFSPPANYTDRATAACRRS